MADVYIIPNNKGAPVSNSDKTIQGPSNPNTQGSAVIGGQGAPAKNIVRKGGK
jgi:hypothetical protein